MRNISDNLANKYSINNTTCCAISTPPVPGGLGVIRISGPQAADIADRVFHSFSGKVLKTLGGYRALYGTVCDDRGEKIDDCVALNFTAPKSYTGENVVELSCHGGVYILRKVLEALYKAGAVPAGKGEFTRRAFMNGKLDLAQAESVMDVISAQSEQAVRAANSVKDGRLSAAIKSIRDELTDICAHLAAWADYPDDDIPQISEDNLKERISSVKSELKKLIDSFDSGMILKEGITAAIVGKPNSGKSTLMNMLAGCEKSIVTSFAGTTRDVVEEKIMLGDIPVTIADTAGIRDTDNPVERIGVELARGRMKSSQAVLAVFDSSEPLDDEDRRLMEELKGVCCIAVINKSDLESRIETDEIKRNFDHCVYISAANNEGIDAIADEFRKIFISDRLDLSAGILYSERQKNDALNAFECMEEAENALFGGFTLDAVTVSCEAAVSALFELTGEKASEAVIDQVFEKFCVGK